MALIDSAESHSERVSMELARGSVRASLTFTGSALSQGRASVTNAAAHLRDALRQAIEQRMTTGKVDLHTFGRVSNGPRDVVSLDDGRVAKELTKQLRAYGVTFAVERTPGAHTFHLMGRDAQVMTHALDVASRRVDDRAARAAAKQNVGERIKARVAQNKLDAPAPTRDQPEGRTRRGGRS